MLNAKFHEKEAEIVAQAGKVGAVTIATNMAGRGTDILLGGNAEFMARRQMQPGRATTSWSSRTPSALTRTCPRTCSRRARCSASWMDKFSVETKKGHDEVVKLGGLHIIGTERHESRRIDNQLRGRAGRQGDPGSSQFFISFEDDLMRLFGSDRFRPMLEKLTAGGEEAIEFGIVSKQIENAQKRVESRNYDIRLHVLQYDDVMNQQREIIYGQRRDVLEGGDMHAKIMEMRRTLIDEAVARHVADEAHRDSWDLDGLSEYLEKLCLDKGGVRKVADELQDATKKNFADALEARAQAIYEAREKMLSEAKIDMREFERVALLSAVDRRWMDHIDAMTELRDGIGLRAYGQRNPIVEYKREGYDMFEEMVRLIQEDTLRRLYFAVLARPVLERRQVAQPIAASHGESAERPAPAKKAAVKVGRNDPCPCGSGKKYKNCCGRNAG